MFRFRIETVDDPEMKMMRVEAFVEPGDTLIARSEAVYHDAEEAKADVTRILQQAWPDKSPFAVDTSIGV